MGKLIDAVKSNSLLGVQQLLGKEYKNSLQVNEEKDEGGFFPLYLAASYGYVGIVEALLKAGAKVDLAMNNAYTPLYAAAFGGHLEVVEVLLKAGARVDLADKYGRTLLYVATQLGDVRAMQGLLKAGAKADLADKDGRTPLHAATQEGKLEVIETLLKAGARVDLADKDGKTPLYIAAQEGKVEAIQILIKAGVKVDLGNKTGATPMFTAALNGHVEVIRALLKAGAKVDLGNNDGVTPLCIAVAEGKVEALEALLKAGAKVDLMNEGATPLFIAAQMGQVEAIRVLLKAGAKVDLMNEGATPLFIAAQMGHVEAFEALLKAGAKVDLATKDNGATLLYTAAQEGNVEVIQALLKAGAKVDLADKDGETPLFRAAFDGKLEVIEALLKAGAKVDLADKDGWRPLHVAAQEGKVGALQALLKAGANSSAKTAAGNTPLDIAKKKGNAQIVTLLQQHLTQRAKEALLKEELAGQKYKLAQYPEAIRLCREAAALGSETAKKIVESYSTNALSLLEKEDMDSQFTLGEMFLYGTDGLTQGTSEALALFQKSAAQGGAAAQYMLGTLHENGQGVVQDSKQAMIWYQKAASRQHVLAGQAIQRLQNTPRNSASSVTVTAPQQRTSRSGIPVTKGSQLLVRQNSGVGQKLAVLESQVKETQRLLNTYRQSPEADKKWSEEMDGFLKGNLDYYQANPLEINTPAFEEALKTLKKEQEGLYLVLGQTSSSSGRFLKVEEGNQSSSTLKTSPRALTDGPSPQSGILQALEAEVNRKQPTDNRPLPALSDKQKPEAIVLIQNLQRLKKENGALDTLTTAMSSADIQADSQQLQKTLQQELVREKQQWETFGLEKQGLEDRIAGLKKSLNDKGDKGEQDKIKAELLGLTERLTGVESQVAILMTEYEIKAKKREALQRFQNHPNLILFYRTVHIKLEEIFISMKTVAGGFVSPVTGNVAVAQSIIESLGDAISIAPLVGPAVEKILKWGVSKVLGKVDETRQNNIAANASALVTLSEAKKVAEGVARQLTESYAEQLLMLATLEDEQNAANRLQAGMQKAKGAVLKQAPCPPVKQLASFAVLWMADVIYDAHQIKDEPLDVLLLSQVRQKSAPDKVKSFWGQVTSKLGMQGLRTTKGDFWPPEEVLTLPGVKVRTHDDKFEYYANKTLNPKKYGWRMANLADVQVLKLQPASNPENTSNVVPPQKETEALKKLVQHQGADWDRAKEKLDRIDKGEHIIGGAKVKEVEKKNAELEKKLEEERIKGQAREQEMQRQLVEEKRKREESEAQTQEKFRTMEAQFAAMQAAVKAPSSGSSSPLLHPNNKRATVYIVPRPKSPRDSKQEDALAALVIQGVRSVFPQLSNNDFYYTALSGAEASDILQNQVVGTFLIRSNAEKNGIIISYVDEDSVVQHTLLKQSGATQFTLDDQTAELAVLLKKYQHSFTQPMGVSRKSVSNNNH